MDFNLRQTFSLLFTLVCFCMSLYLYYSTANESCDYHSNVFRLVCKGFREVRKHNPLNLNKIVRPPPARVSDWINLREGKKYSDYGDNTCGDNKYRKTFTTIFTKWIEIATKLNISYFLTCGSLLGAWRSGDVIPYDMDMDILIDHRDAIKLDKIKDVRNNFSLYDGDIRFVIQEDWRLPVDRRRMLSCDGRHVPAYEGECSFQSLLGRVLKDGLHLDVFDYKNVNGFLHDPTVPGGRYDVKDIFPLKKCRYLGQVTYCPNRPTAVLFKFYGRNLSPHTICKNGTWIKRH